MSEMERNRGIVTITYFGDESDDDNIIIVSNNKITHPEKKEIPLTIQVPELQIVKIEENKKEPLNICNIQKKKKNISH